MPQHSENPLMSGIMSFTPVAKTSFFASKVSPVLVVIVKPFFVFFPLTARSFKNFTVSYFKTCSFAFSAISLGFVPSCVMKLCERSEEHTSELQSRPHLVCRLLLEKKNIVQAIDWMRV